MWVQSGLVRDMRMQQDVNRSTSRRDEEEDEIAAENEQRRVPIAATP